MFELRETNEDIRRHAGYHDAIPISFNIYLWPWMIRRVYVEDIILCYFGSHIMSGFKLIGVSPKPSQMAGCKLKKKKGRGWSLPSNTIYAISNYSSSCVFQCFLVWRVRDHSPGIVQKSNVYMNCPGSYAL